MNIFNYLNIHHTLHCIQEFGSTAIQEFGSALEMCTLNCTPLSHRLRFTPICQILLEELDLSKLGNFLFFFSFEIFCLMR